MPILSQKNASLLSACLQMHVLSLHTYMYETFNLCERLTANTKYFIQGKTRGGILCKR